MMEEIIHVSPDYKALALAAALNPVPPAGSEFVPDAVEEGCEPSFPGLPEVFEEGQTCPWLAAVQHSTRAFKWPAVFGHRYSPDPPDEHTMLRWLRQDEEASNLLNDCVRAIGGGTIWCARVDYPSGQLDPFKTRMLDCDAKALARMRQGPPAALEPEPEPAAPAKPPTLRGAPNSQVELLAMIKRLDPDNHLSRKNLYAAVREELHGQGRKPNERGYSFKSTQRARNKRAKLATNSEPCP